MPLYTMTCVPIPVFTLSQLEKEFRSFLWGDSSSQHGLHLIPCLRFVYQSTKVRLHSLFVRYKALLCKLAAELAFNPNSVGSGYCCPVSFLWVLWDGYCKPKHCFAMRSRIVSMGHLVEFHFIYSIVTSSNISVLTRLVGWSYSFNSFAYLH